MELSNHPILQLEARTPKVWRERHEHSSVGAYTTSHNGNLGSDGSVPAEQKRKSKSVIFVIVPKREEMWKDQREGVHKRSTAESIHPKGGSSVANCLTKSMFITLAVAANEKGHMR
jgi:hypothetical protein